MANFSSRLYIALVTVLAATLTGCTGFETTASGPAASASVISGNLHGGQQPISSSHIYFYAAAVNATYGAASVSLINTTGPGVLTDSNGVGYVTTDINGNWSISSDYTCPSSGAPTYLLAVGGDPGLQPLTTNNTAITLMAEVGSCSTINSGTLVNINEVTTVAAVTALQQFISTPTRMGTTANNLTGLNVAAGLAANVVDRASGLGRSTTLLGNGVIPQTKLNSIANILTPCVNSASYTSTQCSQLFTLATPSGGTQPSDVATAMLLIAQNPGNRVNNIFSLIDSNAPFQPSLSSPPNDYTLGITYTGGGLTAPGDVVIDAAGDAYTSNCPRCNGGSGASSIVGFGPAGAVLTGTSGITTGVSLPQAIAIDQENYIWVADAGRPGVLRLTGSGASAPGFPVNATGPIAIAIDGNSNAWVTNPSSSSVFEVTNTGTLQNTNTNFTAPYGIGIDGNGYIFVADQGASDIAKLSSTGTSIATFNAGGISGPISIAIDHSDEIWTVDNTTNNISKVGGQNGGPASGSPFPGGYQLAVLAIAGDGSVWFTNCRAGCAGSGSTQPDNIIHLSSAGAYITSTAGYQDTHFNGVGTAAIDKSGNLWISNNGSGSLTELLGIAVPVITPLATAVQYNSLGIRP